ncbi:MAG TPA: T9SS type A sorting domain-containing protein [Bacteroidia bacterium]|nr:T9SS type A sorting domain-containing protein [Bacteroidia bacterium]
MIRTIQQSTKAAIILIMFSYIGNPFPAYAKGKALKATLKGQNVTCFGGNNGAINLDISGGNAPYQITWNDGSSGYAMLDKPAGEYSVLITDSKGSIVTQSITLTEPYAMTIYSQVTSEQCYARNGKASLLVTGGTQPYQYEWSNQTRQQNLEAVAAGDYEVKVTDKNGCVKMSNITIERNKVLELNIAKYDPLCNDEASGLIDVEVKGGWAPYTFEWSDGAKTEDQSGLKAGNYSVIVKDNNGCIAKAEVQLKNPDAIKVEAKITEADLYKSNGSIILNVSGGVGNYTYLWSNMENSQSLNNIEEGVYAVRVDDSHRCSTSAYFTVNEKSPMQVESVVKHELCNGGKNGSIKLNVKGGVAPYKFEWSNEMSGATISNLSAGDYSVLITDANNKVYRNTFTVKQPEPIGIFATVLDESVIGKNDGSIKLQVIGGMPPLKYQWSNGQTVSDLANLSQGTYTVRMKDGNGCAMEHHVLVGLNYTDAMLRTAYEKEDHVMMEIYPNPFSNNFTMKFSTPVSNIQSIIVYAMDGKIAEQLNPDLKQQEVNEIAVNASKLKPGSYLIKVTTDKKIFTRIVTRTM